MSSLPEKPNSRRSRNPVNAPFENTDLHRSAAVPETEQLPDQFRSSSFAGAAPEQYQSQNFEAFGQHSSYLQPTYTSTRPSPHSTASHVEESSRGSPFVQADLLYSGREISGSEMMSHRDMGYGYMPSPIPSYSQGQSYGSTLAPTPGYYADGPRGLSGSSGPQYLPNLGVHMTPSEEREQIPPGGRRNSTEIRRRAKLQLRKDRLPSITGVGLEDSQMTTGPVDLFAAASSIQQQTYVPDSVGRSYSRPSNTPLRDDLRQSGHHGYDLSQQHLPSYQTQQSYQSQAPYQPTYTMTSMNPSTLTPPILPTTTGGYPGGRSSPMLQTPLPPASVSSSPHRDPVVVERPPRDRPQCWDHGCNGREFSTFSNLLRHQREKSGTASKAYCPRCGAEFTRTTARNGHMEHGKCKSRRPSVADTTSSNPSNASMPR